MPVDSQRSTSGGKGNQGMFYEREPRLCAAGLPTQQPDDRVADALQHYLLKDEADALISDAIIPTPPARPRPPLRRPVKKDMRFAGPRSDVATIIIPPIKTKFETLVDDLKETSYSSYWRKPLGRVQDPVPMLPEGLDTVNTTFGKKTPFHGSLYDIVMPKVPLPDKTPRAKKLSVQLDRNFCRPAFNENLTYGHRTGMDKRGTYARCCLTDDKKLEGTGDRVVINSIQANFQDSVQPRMGAVLAPFENIKNVPKGYSFGKLKPPDNLPECLTFCKINPGKAFIRQCLSHLNTMRKGLSKRFLPTFFKGFYLNLRYFDKDKSGWLDKKVVYDFCASKLIRFNPSLLEPLLSMWNAFDGSRIEYKTFVHVINYREPSLEMAKVEDVGQDCLEFRTTYTEMVKPGQKADDRLMAGLPSGRYFDLDSPVTPENCCKAIRTCLPHESDMKSCLNPSILTLLNVSHRDMCAQRDLETIKEVFQAVDKDLTEERFQFIFKEAIKMHPKGFVSFETFKQALKANPVFREGVKLSPQALY